MPETPTNLTAISYLRNADLEKFDIVKFLQYFDIKDSASARSFFKNVMKYVLCFSKKDKARKKNEKLGVFAKAMKANKYSVSF
jgi:hypothetical protein